MCMHIIYVLYTVCMHVNMYRIVSFNPYNKPFKGGDVLRPIFQIRKQRYTMLYNLPKATEDFLRLEHTQYDSSAWDNGLNNFATYKNKVTSVKFFPRKPLSRVHNPISKF